MSIGTPLSVPTLPDDACLGKHREATATANTPVRVVSSYLIVRHCAGCHSVPSVMFPELLVCSDFSQAGEPATKPPESDHLWWDKNTLKCQRLAEHFKFGVRLCEKGFVLTLSWYTGDAAHFN